MLFVTLTFGYFWIFSYCEFTTPSSPYSQYDHFYGDNTWTALATAFTLEFFWGGACQYNYNTFIDSNRYYIALPGPDYQESYSGTCGKCIEVSSEIATIEVMVVDECSGCSQSSNGPVWGGVDLSAAAFAKISGYEESYITWRNDFENWLRDDWFSDPSQTQYPQWTDYPPGIWGAGPGSWTVNLTSKNCSYGSIDYGNVKIRVKTKGSDYIEFIVVKSAQTIGQLNIRTENPEENFVELTNDREDNVWHNSGSGIEWDSFYFITLELIPFWFPEDMVSVNIQLPEGILLSNNTLPDIDLGFQFRVLGGGSPMNPDIPDDDQDNSLILNVLFSTTFFLVILIL